MSWQPPLFSAFFPPIQLGLTWLPFMSYSFSYQQRVKNVVGWIKWMEETVRKRKLLSFLWRLESTVENDEKLCFFVSQHWTILWPETIDFFRFLSWLFPRKRGKKIAICQKKSPIYLLTTTVVKVAFPFLLSWHVDIKIKVPHNGKKWPISKSVITIFCEQNEPSKMTVQDKMRPFLGNCKHSGRHGSLRNLLRKE